MQIECDVCNGSGVVPPAQCPACHGTGLVEEETMVDTDARQRRTVVGLLEDLEARITRKRAQVAGANANHERLIAELSLMEELLAEWKEVPRS